MNQEKEKTNQSEKNNIESLKKIPEDAAARIVLSPDLLKKKVDWRFRHGRFVKRFTELLNEMDIIPDAALMADQCDMCYETARKHLEAMCFENYKKELKYLTFPAMVQLSKTAAKDGPQSVTAAKLLQQIGEDWSEKNTQIIVEVNQVIEIANQMLATMKDVIESTDFTDKSFTKEKFTIELLRKVASTIEKLSLNINGNITKT
jgi:hypothetical protein